MRKFLDVPEYTPVGLDSVNVVKNGDEYLFRIDCNDVVDEVFEGWGILFYRVGDVLFGFDWLENADLLEGFDVYKHILVFKNHGVCDVGLEVLLEKSVSSIL